MIWPHSERELDEFIRHMNEANDSIKFTHEYSQKEVIFLDVVVHKKDTHRVGNMLQTKTHVKPTNKQLYVRNYSYHPPGTSKGITIGEAIRFLRTNSDPNQFSDMILKHKRNLIRRGYCSAKITRELKKIKFNMRTTIALKTKNKRNNETEAQLEATKPTFVTRFCPNAGKAFRILHKHWTNIDTDIPILKRFLSRTPRLAYKANANLAKRLVRAKLRPNRDDESTTLATNQTQASNIQQADTTIDSVNIIQKANLKYTDISQTWAPGGRGGVSLCSNSHCPLHNKLIDLRQVTPYVVYLIQCRRCGKQYVGQTQKSLKARYAKHLQNIRDKHSRGALQDHFRKNECGSIEIMMQLLHKVIPENHETQTQTEETLKRIETLWIDRLMSEFPQGLNWVRYDSRTR